MPLTPSPLNVEFALLSTLRRQPRHGYDIHQQLSDPAGLGLVLHFKQSRVYAMLSRLEEHGYIRAEYEPQDSHPTRKVFHLTETGTTAYLTWIGSAVEHGREFRLQFLSKLYCAQREGEDFARTLLAKQRDACQGWFSDQTAAAASLPQDQMYEWLVHQFRIGQIQSMLNWLDICEARLLPSENV
jgi:DNA-binding PadR family transcriptional regulator